MRKFRGDSYRDTGLGGRGFSVGHSENEAHMAADIADWYSGVQLPLSAEQYCLYTPIWHDETALHIHHVALRSWRGQFGTRSLFDGREENGSKFFIGSYERSCQRAAVSDYLRHLNVDVLRRMQVGFPHKHQNG